MKTALPKIIIRHIFATRFDQLDHGAARSSLGVSCRKKPDVRCFLLAQSGHDSSTKRPPRSPFNPRDFKVFAGAGGAVHVVGARVGIRGLGAVIVLVNLIGSRSSRIPYGWEDREPSGYITGVLAKMLFALGD